MQESNNKDLEFKLTLGKIVKELRETKTNCSINNFARAYGFDRGNLSNLERGKIGCHISTAWKLSEALGIKFSDFAKILEEKLGNDFKLIEE